MKRLRDLRTGTLHRRRPPEAKRVGTCAEESRPVAVTVGIPLGVRGGT